MDFLGIISHPDFAAYQQNMDYNRLAQQPTEVIVENFREIFEKIFEFQLSQHEADIVDLNKCKQFLSRHTDLRMDQLQRVPFEEYLVVRQDADLVE